MNGAGRPLGERLRKVDESEILHLFPGSDIAFVRDLGTIRSGGTGGGLELWRWIGAVFAALLMVEMLLAWRFSHHD